MDGYPTTHARPNARSPPASISGNVVYAFRLGELALPEHLRGALVGDAEVCADVADSQEFGHLHRETWAAIPVVD